MLNGVKQRPKGQRTRAAILAEAARLATVDGLDGLSIGGLATAIGMSKSGLYAHFGSKEDLQLATIASARETFVAEVFVPALARARRASGACTPPATRFCLTSSGECSPADASSRVAAADVGTRGRARCATAVAAQQRDWTELLERLAGKAMELGELAGRRSTRRSSPFELNAVLVSASSTFILQGDPAVFERARAAVRRRVSAGQEL